MSGNEINSNERLIKEDGGFLLFDCPHCDEGVIVKKNQVNCTIFRHGVFKNNYKQMGPHTKKEMCDYYFENGLIYGCGKPFKIVRDKAVICGYI